MEGQESTLELKHFKREDRQARNFVLLSSRVITRSEVAFMLKKFIKPNCQEHSTAQSGYFFLDNKKNELIRQTVFLLMLAPKMHFRQTLNQKLFLMGALFPICQLKSRSSHVIESEVSFDGTSTKTLVLYGSACSNSCMSLSPAKRLNPKVQDIKLIVNEVNFPEVTHSQDAEMTRTLEIAGSEVASEI